MHNTLTGRTRQRHGRLHVDLLGLSGGDPPDKKHQFPPEHICHIMIQLLTQQISEQSYVIKRKRKHAGSETLRVTFGFPARVTTESRDPCHTIEGLDFIIINHILVLVQNRPEE